MADKPKTTGFEALAQETTLYPQEKLAKVAEGRKSFFIGLPKEVSFQENRITLTPEAVELLVRNGHEVWVESGAGTKAKFPDSLYNEAGAKIAYSPEEVYKADVIIKIEPPTLSEIEMMRPGQILISAVQYGNVTPEYLKALISKRVIAIGFEFIEDKAGGYPIIRAMSEIAGSSAIFIAAEYLNSIKGGKGKLLGGITGVPPTKVLILGAGTVAEYAARAALGLGAEVKIFDNHIYKLRRLRHTLGSNVYTSTLNSVLLADCLKSTDVVIGAMRPEKGVSSMIITEEMVMEMRAESVIIDLSIDHGGCVETSKLTSHKDPVYRVHDVIHYCVPNIPSVTANTSSTALSNIFTPTIVRAGDEGGIGEMIFNHSWFLNGVYAYKGTITNKHIARKFGMECRDLNLLKAARI